MRFDNRCSWAVYFHHGVIVRVLGYLDSVIVARLFEENPSMPESVAVGTTVNPSPPAQIRTCRLPAYGSYLEWMARKRASG
jgi:hypothetical protein